jgi:GDP-L-fucose synthase
MIRRDDRAATVSASEGGMQSDAKIIITGGTGLVGTALTKELNLAGFRNVLSLGSADCDLMDWHATRQYFLDHRCDYLFHLAARVYGIMGNMRNKGVSFFDNVMMNTHAIEAARLAGVRKIVAMGSGCVYPYPPPALPLAEDMVWSGPPHESEDSYAHAKRAMLAQLVAYGEQYQLPYAFVISGNLYGPNDKFDPEFGHVTPALVRKFHEARLSGSKVVVWGHGSARRDFMYSGDVARALLAIADNVEGPVNLGSGTVNAIRVIVETLAEETGLQDRVVWDASKPDGQDHRAYDLTKLFATGFRPHVEFRDGLRATYAWYAAQAHNART